MYLDRSKTAVTPDGARVVSGNDVYVADPDTGAKIDHAVSFDTEQKYVEVVEWLGGRYIHSKAHVDYDVVHRVTKEIIWSVRQ